MRGEFLMHSDESDPMVSGDPNDGGSGLAIILFVIVSMIVYALTRY